MNQVQEAHSHDNYDTLSKIRYTGDAEEIDLADIEGKADIEHNHDDLYQPIGDYAPAKFTTMMTNMPL